MTIATIILVIGKPLYVFKPPQGNVLGQVCGGIWVNMISFGTLWNEEASMVSGCS